MTDVQQSAPTVAITVNGSGVDAKPGELVIDAAQKRLASR